MTVSWKRRYGAMLLAVVVAAALLAIAFAVLRTPLGEVTASRFGAGAAVLVGPALAGRVSREHWSWSAGGVGVTAVLGLMALAVSSWLDATGEFLALGLGTAWLAGVAMAIHADMWTDRLGRLFLVGLAGPLLLIAAAVGFTFAVVGSVPALLALAGLVPAGDALAAVVANAGGGENDPAGVGRVDRPGRRRER